MLEKVTKIEKNVNVVEFIVIRQYCSSDEDARKALVDSIEKYTNNCNLGYNVFYAEHMLHAIVIH